MIAGVTAGGRPVPASPPPAGLPHSYWRIRVTKTQAVNYSSFGEIEMAATIGGADQCVGGTPSDSAGAGAATVFDNNTETAWWWYDPPQWVAYQFATPVAVASVRITAENGNFAGVAASPKDFTVEYSDNGTSWVVAATVTGQTGWAAREVRTFNL